MVVENDLSLSLGSRLTLEHDVGLSQRLFSDASDLVIVDIISIRVRNL